MKKLIWTCTLLLGVTFFLTACQAKNATTPTTSSTSSTTATSATQKSATLTITKASDASQSVTVKFQAGATVLEVLEDNFKVEAKDGFITAIDGLSQDTDKGIYWLYDVNGTQAPKGANQTPVNPGDVIEFKYAAYK